MDRSLRKLTCYPVRYARTRLHLDDDRVDRRRSALCFSRGIFLGGIRACRSYPENKASVARSCRSWLGPRRKGSCSTTVAFTVYTIPNPISSLGIFERTSQLLEECHDSRAVSSDTREQNYDNEGFRSTLHDPTPSAFSLSLSLSIRPSSLAMRFLNSWKCANF